MTLLRTLSLVLPLALFACTGADPTDDTDTGTDTSTGTDADADGFDADVDCDDSNASVNPDADETCNGRDDDCDELVDDADDDLVDGTPYYADSDSDGFGTADDAVTACSAPAGRVADATDCDDANGDIHPGADEICNDVDDDCDSLTDDEDDSITDATTYYGDVDEDGWGAFDSGFEACETPSGYATREGDCDDANPEINPDADEICDDVDNDCDAKIDDRDDDLTGAPTWYEDADEDGYGGSDSTTNACEAPSGYVADATDCDDADAAIYPGRFDWGDEADNDCDGSVDEDVGSETYSLDADIQSIFSANCTRCHGTSGGLTLTSAYSAIVNVKASVSGLDYIEPGDPTKSYMWHKLNNTHLSVGGAGVSMPRGGPTLATRTLDMIETWILEGAVE